MLTVIPPDMPRSLDTFQVWICEPPGMAVNVPDPEIEIGQAVAVRLKMDIEHSTIKKAATLKNETRYVFIFFL